jgi:muramoyltetrapeptide carboxypeptidase LdcA involved in peptidoglycan recycling
MLKAAKLNKGDRVATISPSSGNAGEAGIRWRYDLGSRRLKDVFGLEAVAMPNSLRGVEYNAKNPEGRAEDLLKAFCDETIKSIICNIGGDDSIRMLPYIDLDTIKANPKVLTGFSDVTSLHMICRRAGLSTFYGPALLTDFAENHGVFGYTADYFRRAVFCDAPIGKIDPPGYWTSEFLDWNDRELNRKARRLEIARGFKLISGKGNVHGKLIGGCLSVLYNILETPVFPDPSEWDGTIVFIETPETTPSPALFEKQIHGLCEKSTFSHAAGLVFARPYGNMYDAEYKLILKRVIADELGRPDMPILADLPFGHTSPIITIPFGAMACIDSETRSFSIVDNGVV